MNSQFVVQANSEAEGLKRIIKEKVSLIDMLKGTNKALLDGNISVINVVDDYLDGNINAEDAMKRIIKAVDSTSVKS